MLKKIYSLIIIATLFFLGIVFADVPEPGLYTLSDIYSKITDGDYSYSAHEFAPITGPASTFKTLTEIWEAIPPFKTLVENDLDTGIFPAGIYSTDTDLSLIDTDLVASNIATGTMMFGVEGTYEPVDICFVDVASFEAVEIEWYGSDTPEEMVIWDTASSTCAELSTYGGYNSGVSWRLPSVTELTDYYNVLPGLPDGFQADYYWSNYVYVSPPFPDNTKVVNMDNGNTDSGRPKTSSAYTRCVRS